MGVRVRAALSALVVLSVVCVQGFLGSAAKAANAITLNSVVGADVDYNNQPQSEFDMTPTIALTLAQGQTHYMKASLTFSNPNNRSDVVTRMRCTGPDGQYQQLEHGGNDSAGAQFTVTSRLLVTATTTGTYTCQASAFINTLCNPPGFSGACTANPATIGSITGTIQDVATVVGDQMQLQAFQNTNLLGGSGQPTRVPAVNAPLSAVVGPTFDAHADVQISDCYQINTGQGCTSTASAGQTTINYELIVNQLDSTGHLCSGGQSTVTQSGYVINSTRHHDVVYPQILQIALLPTCVSTIQAYLLVTWSAGDPFTIDGPGPESDVWLLPTSL